jgi:hypothetical protein
MNELPVGIIIGLLLAYVSCYIIFQGFLLKDTTMTICFPDGTWLKGIRKRKYISQETRGTHHFMIIETSDTLKDLMGKRIAIPINSVKYFVIKDK